MCGGGGGARGVISAHGLIEILLKLDSTGILTWQEPSFWDNDTCIIIPAYDIRPQLIPLFRGLRNIVPIIKICYFFHIWFFLCLLLIKVHVSWFILIDDWLNYVLEMAELEFLKMKVVSCHKFKGQILGVHFHYCDCYRNIISGLVSHFSCNFIAFSFLVSSYTPNMLFCNILANFTQTSLFGDPRIFTLPETTFNGPKNIENTKI